MKEEPAMAREKQVDQPNKKQSTTTATSTARGRDAAATTPASERERNIETGRERSIDTGRERNIDTGRERGGRAPSSFERPYSASIRGQSSSPFSLMRRMAEDMDRLFDTFTQGRSFQPTLRSAFDEDLWGGGGGLSSGTQTIWSPQVEVIQRGDKLVVRADLPGLRKEDVDVEVENDVLTITGERKHEQEENREGYFRSERSYGRFYRALPLPEGVDSTQVEASFNDGVLEVSIPAPRAEDRKGKKIQIR
jgi:HSP20 family protein